MSKTITLTEHRPADGLLTIHSSYWEKHLAGFGRLSK